VVAEIITNMVSSVRAMSELVSHMSSSCYCDYTYDIMKSLVWVWPCLKVGWSKLPVLTLLDVNVLAVL